MKRKEMIKDYKFFTVKQKEPQKGEVFKYVETPDKVEFIFIYQNEVYWRSEYNPAHCNDIEEHHYYPFSATIQDDEMPLQAAFRKIEEGTGFVIQEGRPIYQEHLYESKHISAKVHLRIFLIESFKTVPPREDQTFWQKNGKTLAAPLSAFMKEVKDTPIETSLSLKYLLEQLKQLDLKANV